MNYVTAFGSIENDWTEFDKIFNKIAFLLFHTNFASDFLLYNFSSKTFRNVAWDLLISPKCVREISNRSNATLATTNLRNNNKNSLS
jgi:hypothetical protein